MFETDAPDDGAVSEHPKWFVRARRQRCSRHDARVVIPRRALDAARGLLRANIVLVLVPSARAVTAERRGRGRGRRRGRRRRRRRRGRATGSHRRAHRSHRTEGDDEDDHDLTDSAATRARASRRVASRRVADVDRQRALRECVNVRDLRARARDRVSKFAFDYLDGGADDEKALARASDAFDDQFHPSTCRGCRRPRHDDEFHGTPRRGAFSKRRRRDTRCGRRVWA